MNENHINWARQVIVQVSLSSNTVVRGHEARAEETEDLLLVSVCKVAPFGDGSNTAGEHLGKINLQTARPGKRGLRKGAWVIQVMTEGITVHFISLIQFLLWIVSS